MVVMITTRFPNYNDRFSFNPSIVNGLLDPKDIWIPNVQLCD